MRVAIDATPLTLTSGGVTRYTQELSCALAREFPGDEFTLLCDHPFSMPPAPPANLVEGSLPGNQIEKRWWLAGLQCAMSRRGCDLFHGTNFLAPWLPTRPSVITVHDISLWLDRGWHGDSGFLRWRIPTQIGLGLATMIVTPTHAVRRQVIDYFRLHPARVVAVPLGASPGLRPVAVTPGRTPYFVFVGTLEPRKNLGMLLNAWRTVCARHKIELVLAGRRRADFRVPLEPEPGLRLLGEVPDAELPALFSRAAAVLYPSFYEGFGLPVLEALQCGALVIASNDPAVREVAGDAAIFLDPRDERAWAESMSACVANPESVAHIRARALGRAALYSWARTAQLTREVYVEALRRWSG